MNSINEIADFLEDWAPLKLAEDYDNVGLLVGKSSALISKILVSLDVTEDVIEEAISTGCQLVVSHHPVLFQGIKRLNGQNYVARTIEKAIRAGISIYAIHTNLDNVSSGVNKKMADVLGLVNTKILRPVPQKLLNLSWFTPIKNSQFVQDEVHKAGAGNIGNYSDCSFSTQGIGQFRPNEQANPHIGEIGKTEKVSEIKSEVVLPEYLKNKVLNALFKAHPYEVVAYSITRLENEWQDVGSGMVGELPEGKPWNQFVLDLKNSFGIQVFNHTKPMKEVIKKVALCGGSGFFLLPDSIRAGADVFITSDIKYHQFFDAEGRITLVDMGHYESEKFTSNLLMDKLSNHFPNIAVILSQTRTNPVFYA